jgi:hypothetical protein
LGSDYIEFLAKVQKAAKENPVDVEFDLSLPASAASIKNINGQISSPC